MGSLASSVQGKSVLTIFSVKDCAILACIYFCRSYSPFVRAAAVHWFAGQEQIHMHTHTHVLSWYIFAVTTHFISSPSGPRRLTGLLDKNKYTCTHTHCWYIFAVTTHFISSPSGPRRLTGLLDSEREKNPSGNQVKPRTRFRDTPTMTTRVRMMTAPHATTTYNMVIWEPAPTLPGSTESPELLTEKRHDGELSSGILGRQEKTNVGVCVCVCACACVCVHVTKEMGEQALMVLGLTASYVQWRFNVARPHCNHTFLHKEDKPAV